MNCVEQFFATKEIIKTDFEKEIGWLYTTILQLNEPKVVYVQSPEEFDRLSPIYDKKSKFNFCKNIEDQILDKIMKPAQEALQGKILCSIGEFSYNYEGLNEKLGWRTIKESLFEIRDQIINGYTIHFFALHKKFANVNFFLEWFDSMSIGFQHFYNLVKAGGFRAYFYEDIVIAIQPPITLYINKEGELHNAYEKAIQFPDNFGLYYIKGKKIESHIFENISKDRFINERNEDWKTDMISIIRERYGSEGIIKFLDAHLVDEKIIKHSENYSEIVRLYKTLEKIKFLKNRFGELNQPYCWTEIFCPSTGRNYFLDNSADFTDALEALKFLRPSFVPENLLYQWKNFAN